MKLLLFVFATLAISNAVPLNHFLFGTDGQEVIYNYYADVRVGVADQKFGSQYVFKADLHMRLDAAGNGTFAYFKNPGIYLYNGQVLVYGFESHMMKEHDQHHYDYKFVPILKESEYILKPFYITYDEYGQVHEIFTAKGDQEWSVNIKKGVASVLQIDWHKFNTYYKKHPFVYTNEEYTTFGHVNMTYDVYPKSTGYVIHKTFDFYEAPEFEYDFYTNYEIKHDYKPYHYDNATYVNIEYDIYQEKDKKIVKYITCETAQYMTSFYEKGPHVLYTTNQTFVYVGIEVPKEPYTFADFPIYNYLTYTHLKGYDSHFLTYYGTEQHVQTDVVFPLVKGILYEAVEYLQENPVTKTETDTKQGLSIHRISEALAYFSVDVYEQFYTYITKSTTPKDLAAIELFYRILPTVGTKASAIFVKNLIKKHTVKDYVATQMLYSLGKNVRAVSVELLHDLEDFVNFEDVVKPEVYHAAILAYGRLVYKTYKYTHDEVMVEKYIKMFYNKLKTAKTYEQQLVWLHGLKNIQVGSVYKLLLPLVEGEQVLELTYDRHLRLQAIYGFREAVHDHAYIYEYLWPIFVDTTLPVELRIAALKGILSTEDVTYLTKAFWWMNSEVNHHLYSYFYSVVYSLAESTIKFDTPIGKYARYIAKYYKYYEVDTYTKAFYYDYADPEYGFGGTVSGNYISTKDTNQFYIQFNPYVMDHEFNLYGIYVKFEGYENPLPYFLPQIMSHGLKAFKEPIHAEKTDVPVHVEITFVSNGKVVYTKYYNHESIDQIFKSTYMTIMSLYKYHTTSVWNAVQSDMYVPTFLGIPAVYSVHIPVVWQFNYDVTMPEKYTPESLIKVLSNFRVWAHGTYETTIYNPFADTYHGYRRVLAYDFNVPFNFGVSLNPAQSTLKFVFEKVKNINYAVLGFKTHVKSQVYARYMHVDYLKQTCEDCHQYETVTFGPKYKTPLDVVYEAHVKPLGLHYYAAVFDAEGPQYMKHYKSLADFFVNKHFRTISDVSFSKFFVTTYNWFMLTFFPPEYTSFGFVAYQNPCRVYPAEKAEWVIRVDNEHVDEIEPHYYYTPEIVSNARFSYILKGVADEIIEEFTGGVHAKHSKGFLFKDVDFHMTRKIPGEENMNVCVDWIKEYTKDRVYGKFHYYQGYSRDYQCIKNDFSFKIEYDGIVSAEQRNYTYEPNYSYKHCHPHYFNVTTYPVSYDCAFDYTTVRDYTYHVGYKHVPDYIYETIKPMWSWFHEIFPSYYDYEPHHHVATNGFRVDVKYPIHYDYYPVKDYVVTFPEETYVFEHVKYNNWFWFFQPDSTYFTQYHRLMKFLGHVDVCSVYPEHKVPEYHEGYYVAEYPKYNEWKLYFADAPKDYHYAVYVEQVKDNQVAVKFVVANSTVIVQPKVVDPKGTEHKHYDHKYTFIADEQFIHYAQESYETEKHSFELFQVNDAVVFVVPNIPLYVVYDGYHVYFDVVKGKYPAYGECFKHYHH
uniref:Putative crossveinless d n=1 Tax=Corethrella appendiculata TaxID=1370023 RepID=W4VR27_9DIPT